MNIIILTNSIRGLYSFRKEVISALVDQGFKVIISCPDEHDEKFVFFEGMGCTMIQTFFNRRGTNPIADLKQMLYYKSLLKKYKPFVVLTYTIKPNVYGGIACRLLGIPQLANVTGLGDAIENGGLMRRLTLLLYKIGTSKAYKLFFQNKSNYDYFSKHGIGLKRAKLLPGSGVNLQWHKYQPYPKDGIVKFLFVGRLLKDKGIEEFFKMAQDIKKQFPNTEFDIVGRLQDNYKEELDRLVSCKVITYYGQVSDVRPFYSQSHCVILPSYHEGMSNVNLESAANGRPVITTNVPGCKETVDDGVTGFLVSPRSAEDLTKKVKKFIMLPYEAKVQMGKAAHNKVEQQFDRQIVVDAYIKAVKELIK